MAFRKPSERGLPSLNQSRAERRRAFLVGRVAVRSLPPAFWAWTALGFLVFFVIYYRVALGRLEAQKAQIMARQRAVAQELGPRLEPFRDRVERWVAELAGEWRGSHREENAAAARVENGVYLRLRIQEATPVKALRKAAEGSLLDGFTSCFFRIQGAPSPHAGPPCRQQRDCEAGRLCNEYNVCAEPPRPFNLRLAYRSLRILGTEWTDELHTTENEKKVLVFERELERATREDVPLALEVLVRSRYFTVVLDEDPEQGLPPPLEGTFESEVERLHRTPHYARVAIWRLADGVQVVRHRARAEGRLQAVGRDPVTDPRLAAAQARQANSCALGLALADYVGPPPGDEAERGPAPSGSEGAPPAVAPGGSAAASP